MAMSFEKYRFTVTERFLTYVKIDTQSDPFSKSFPSTEKQKDLSRLLVKELKEMGLQDAKLDENGYVYATLPANTEKEKVPVLCFCSHVDTSPDSSGKDVKPVLHQNYDGGEIRFPDDPGLILSPDEHPDLKKKIGDDLITASGKTLLGADDKSGVSIIMDALHFLLQHPEIKHGKIRVLFTPDEEVGKGVSRVDMQKLGADFGYTMDGGELGSFEDENFNADQATLTIEGVSMHPGFAKGKLVNAIKILSELIDKLPKDGLSPETTADREGFIHPVHIEGIAEKATATFILRDFEEGKLEEYKGLLQELLDDTVKRYPGAKGSLQVEEQYRNMRQVITKHPEVSEYAKQAIREAGIKLLQEPIRGGTDGANLSFKGLPCPNIFTGQHAFHSKLEWISVQDMQKAVEVVVRLCNIWEKNTAE